MVGISHTIMKGLVEVPFLGQINLLLLLPLSLFFALMFTKLSR